MPDTLKRLAFCFINRYSNLSAVFGCRSAREVLDHLLESGAGTVFYDSIDGKSRDHLTEEFLSILTWRNGPRKTFEVKHDFLACIARKKGPCPEPKMAGDQGVGTS